MGFKEEKSWLLDILKSGTIVHDFRGMDSDKNWLSDARLSTTQAIEIISLVKGDQSESRPHHFDPNRIIWIFKVTAQGCDWYIKFHRVDPTKAKFISFHPSEEAQKP